MLERVRQDKFHGRTERGGRPCDWAGCSDAGEFRAPGERPSGFDGPGEYRWYCLDHVRAFNQRYDYFAGMSTGEILKAQSPLAGWERETRAFRPTAGIDSAPRWADFEDPLEAIAKRARSFADAAARRHAQRPDGTPLSPEERRALDTLDLAPDAGRTALRRRYAELLRRYHPDHNGGDRNHEARLRAVVEAYQLLRKAGAFT